jgi:hypothetical protein
LFYIQFGFEFHFDQLFDMFQNHSKQKHSKEQKSKSQQKMSKNSSEENKSKTDSEEVIKSNIHSNGKEPIDPFKDNKRFKILKKIISHTCLLITVLGISFFIIFFIIRL